MKLYVAHPIRSLELVVSEITEKGRSKLAFPLIEPVSRLNFMPRSRPIFVLDNLYEASFDNANLSTVRSTFLIEEARPQDGLNLCELIRH